MPPGDMGKVRFVTSDSMRVLIDDAYLIDNDIVGAWDGYSVQIPVNRISSIEPYEANGFLIFLVVNVTSFVFLKQGLSLFARITKL